MSADRFGYQGEKLSQARSSLMAPHLRGEEHSFAFAFQFCSRAFHQFDIARIEDEDAVEWIKTIQRLMDTSNVEDSTEEGTYVHRARLMTEDEKYEFSKAVDELASWFNREFWSER
jgi:hypothetical protein